MLSTIAFVVAGLSSGHEIGLALVAAAFIVFALVSSFVIPRRNPNFPGRGMGGYITLCVLFFAAMLAAVVFLGKERKGGNEANVHTTAVAGTLPGQGATTGAQQTTPQTTTTSSTPSAGTGDAAAGKGVFTSAGCSSCHTLKDAGATGTVGPNLDQLKPAQAVVAHQVENGGAIMPAFKGKLSQKQIDDVAAYVFKATHS
jgi:mono/diheme cytochrome c family protein